MNSPSLNTVAPGTGRGFHLSAGTTLRIVDVSGQQSGDLMAFCASDHTEVLSNGRSFDYWNRIYARRGDTLYSNRSRAMFTIVEAAGRHDFLYGACSREMYERQYGIRDHRNCYDNLLRALREAGVDAAFLPTPFNVFMNAEVLPDGTLAIHAPESVKGDCITLRAEMDLIVALTSCPSTVCNGGSAKALGYETLEP